MRAFTPGQPANVVHSSLKSASSAMEAAKQNAILWFGEIVERKLFRDLGYSTVHHYAEQELGWSQSKTYDFLNICRKLEKLPKVKTKVASGDLGYAHALEVVKVTDANNQDQWLDLALNSTRRELAREVKQAKQDEAAKASGQTPLLPNPEQRPAAIVSSRVTMEMSSTQLARYEALWEKMRKLRGLPADKVEALLEMMAFFVDENSNRLENRPASSAPPVQLHIHQCPDCARATTQTSRGEMEISSGENEKSQCDAQVSRPGKRNTATIVPRTRREVLARDRHRCQRPGCGNNRYLEIHHKIPRSAGGLNEAGNLVTLCSACHALIHERPEVGRELLLDSR